jgi:cob(I)alamin adenosyltransferase
LKIYTKTGDRGETGLVGGARALKDSARIQAIGAVDELNAVLGITLCQAQNTSLSPELARIQNWLFDLGAELATPGSEPGKNQTLSEQHVRQLEHSIDAQTVNLRPLRNFILPGGSPLAANLHLARCVCRRAEREMLALHREAPVREVTLAFINRLSDWIFVSARTANAECSVEDIEWRSEG